MVTVGSATSFRIKEEIHRESLPVSRIYLSPELMLGSPSRSRKACGDTELGRVNLWGQAEGEKVFVYWEYH